jgi:methionyl-tRNA formyltransferase
MQMPRVVFIGSKQAGLECLQTVHAAAPETLAGIVTLDDADDTRSVYDEFCSFAESVGQTMSVAANPREAERLVRELEPDLCLVVGWYWLLSPELLASVPRGVLGVHNSLLPRYRGAAPLVWALINGEAEVGFSLFSLGEGMDDGPIWAQRSVAVAADDYVSDVLEKVTRSTTSLLEETWPAILEGELEPVPQDSAAATYAALRTPEDGRIDWTRSASDVYNFVRAQSRPYPGAFTLLADGDRLTVWRARPVDARFYGTPGQVAQIRPDGVYVICGDHRPLLVEEVGTKERPALPVGDVLKSLKTRLG